MGRHRVIIVDDQALARAILRAMVTQDADLEVVGEAANGLDAIRAVGEFAPNLVLMDVTMPEMNGIQATREIKRHYPHVRVIMVSTHDSEEDVRASMKAGADGYVVKGAGQDEFRTAIRGALLRNARVAMSIKSRIEIEAELARATAERGKARVALSVLGKVPGDRRCGRVDPFKVTIANHNASADRRKANSDLRRSQTDRRKAEIHLPKGVTDRRRGYRRKADAVVAARDKAFVDWRNANAALEKALAALAKSKG